MCTCGARWSAQDLAYAKLAGEGTGKSTGKGKGGKRLSGKGISNYIMSLSDEDYEEMFFA